MRRFLTRRCNIGVVLHLCAVRRRLIYAEIHAAEVSSGGSYLGNAMAEKTIGPGSLADSLLSANLTLTDASTAKTHGEWYIEGAIGTVIRFHFVTPALVA
jgi:hypothetical protein